MMFRSLIAVSILLATLGMAPVLIAQERLRPESEVRPAAPTVTPAAPSASRAMVTRLPDVHLIDTPLGDVIEFLRDVSGANIHVDWRALEIIGVGRDTPITVRLRNATLGMVLRFALREAGGEQLMHYIDGGVIHITTRAIADDRMIVRIYPILDLIVEIPDFEPRGMSLHDARAARGGRSGGGGAGLFGGQGTRQTEDQALTRRERAEQLIELITSTIEPDIWDVAGGKARIRYLNGNLIVTAPRHVHERLAAFPD